MSKRIQQLTSGQTEGDDHFLERSTARYYSLNTGKDKKLNELLGMILNGLTPFERVSLLIQRAVVLIT